jgi:hypothetical protein
MLQMHFETFYDNKIELHSSLAAVWPDEFVKNRPKCSPNGFLTKLLDDFYSGKKKHQNFV